MQQKALTVRETAQRLGTTTRSVQLWIHEGHFPNAYRLNPHAERPTYRIPETDVAAFEAARKK